MQVMSPSEEREVALSSQLLIVSDDAYLRATVGQQLALEGFQDVSELGMDADFDATLSNVNLDLILLDNKTPDGSGVDICRRLRRIGFSKPIVFLSTKGTKNDMALALEAGANDYITKPLRMGDLIARICAQLFQFRAPDDAGFDIGNLSFVSADKMLYEIGNNRMEVLTEKEAKILEFLHQTLPNDVSKEEILSEVWGFKNGITTHTLETHIYRLRQKIKRITKKQIVLTTENGYRLTD